MRVMVLGCGPAGLMAAQGVFDAHGDMHDGEMRMVIASRKEKSPLYGAQYLHAPIPKFTPPEPVQVAYQLRGSTDDYRRKVYGQMWNGTVSPEDLTDEHSAWDIRETYNRLWERWEHRIDNVSIDPIGLMGVLGEFDLVISSIPAPAICHEGHVFGATMITAAGDAPALDIRVPYTCPPNTVICNGEESPSWYRMSKVYGYTTVEWPDSIETVPIQTAARVQKPTRSECNCFPDVLKVGRYGKWEKGVLSHTSYFDAYRRVIEMLGDTGAAEEG